MLCFGTIYDIIRLSLNTKEPNINIAEVVIRKYARERQKFKINNCKKNKHMKCLYTRKSAILSWLAPVSCTFQLLYFDGSIPPDPAVLLNQLKKSGSINLSWKVFILQ